MSFLVFVLVYLSGYFLAFSMIYSHARTGWIGIFMDDAKNETYNRELVLAISLFSWFFVILTTILIAWFSLKILVGKLEVKWSGLSIQKTIKQWLETEIEKK